MYQFYLLSLKYNYRIIGCYATGMNHEFLIKKIREENEAMGDSLRLQESKGVGVLLNISNLGHHSHSLSYPTYKFEFIKKGYSVPSSASVSYSTKGKKTEA